MGKEYTNEYTEWRKKNPGYIMHGSSIKASAAIDLASYCHTIDELRVLTNIYKRKMEHMESSHVPHGFRFTHAALSEILHKCETYFEL